ncbi:ParB family chromosome partitioning protein [Deinococcus metalli]|uniref:Chromosome 1-partitioning protein ParB n=1 Tax=Deinococcus metalli TaxID=1141878 RepID=A0A7W8KIB3_9DEIO|nr:ParB/RepB/Spo0J family partition protein ParB [Deinococcus metalli]MBB5378405.1 ParB family chromosome partitioning protein [Deinococcus metalli]GHF59189.1 putative chromosome 1-partitioning protein ParB [Deinococcus metalli]
MSKKSSLGRGLDALLARPAAEATGPQVQTLKIDRIVQAAYQPRQVFESGALAELAQSIREKGVLQPLLVRPRGDAFEIVAGERRWRASQLAGLTELPVIIRDLADRDALEIAIVENLQREDLGPLEEARAYQALLDHGLNQEGVAQAVGKGRSTVANALRLLSLPAPALGALEAGEISAGHARAILAQPEGDRLWALEQIRARSLNVRESEGLKREARTPQPVKVNPPRAYRQVELDLSRRTGTRVKIIGADKGRVELNYASREELDRILELLGYSAE